MANILVVAGPGERRDGWCRRIQALGYGTVAESELLAGQRELDQPCVAGMVFAASSVDELVVLGALSSVRVLPPVVVVSDVDHEAVPSRLPAVRHLDRTAGPGLVARAIDGLIRSRAPTPAANLPFRMCHQLTAQWTSFLQIAADAVDDFDGKTQPEGYELG